MTAVTRSADGTVTGKELKTDIKSWSQCAGSCPEPGSEITITDVSANQVYDLKYGTGDATATARTRACGVRQTHAAGSDRKPAIPEFGLTEAAKRATDG